jgi:DNA-3-methyladenine glycosylase II
MTERYAAARKHLRAADPVLARLIDKHPNFDPRAWMAELPKMDTYGALVFQIVGQQLSVRRHESDPRPSGGSFRWAFA